MAPANPPRVSGICQRVPASAARIPNCMSVCGSGCPEIWGKSSGYFATCGLLAGTQRLLARAGAGQLAKQVAACLAGVPILQVWTAGLIGGQAKLKPDPALIKHRPSKT
ncbi:hypothetical protein PCASD_02704 [Puccinia coronata f. sp. avenae]|uniref:Uncharacterized protein n=1 Tax=Puccinia coronata f. sp. avenae TaxID=200324 RepID=A0A2N5VHG4_9BASI|nr:hypothetical protein PCASD_02704 [Puccinia coronata f. sp. avenae]